MLTLGKLRRLAALALDDQKSDVPNAAEEFHAWAVDHVEEIARALASPVDTTREALRDLDPSIAPEAVLKTCDGHGTRERVRDRDDAERSTEADALASRLGAGAVQVEPGVWSLDPVALVDLARAVLRAGKLARDPFLALTPDASAPVHVSARLLVEAARVTPPEAWTVDLRTGLAPVAVERRPADWGERLATMSKAYKPAPSNYTRPGAYLAIQCTRTRGYRLASGPDHRGATPVPLPPALPVYAFPEVSHAAE